MSSGLDVFISGAKNSKNNSNKVQSWNTIEKATAMSLDPLGVVRYIVITKLIL